MMQKILIIGLDGATWDLLRPWALEGKLPVIRKLMNEGSWGYLESTFPPITSPAWISFATGKNPGKLGIYGLMKKVGSSYEFQGIKSTSHNEDTLWEILSRNGLFSGIVNIPGTYPPKPLNGFLVGGVFVPHTQSEYTYPKELKNKLNQIVSGYKISILAKYLLQTWGIKRFLEELYDVIGKQQKAIKYLLKNERWDLFAFNLLGGDWMQHFLWKYMDKTHVSYDKGLGQKYGQEILKYYQKIDLFIKELSDIVKEKCGDFNIFIMSDHGFGKINGKLNINDWLIKKGYLVLKSENKRPLKFFLRFGISREKLNYILHSFGFDKLKTMFPKKIRRLVPSKEKYLTLDEVSVDWSKTKAYSPGCYGKIYINLKGRDMHGCVDPEDSSALVNDIINDLKKLRDPFTGKKLNIAFFKPKEVYVGNAGCAPDLQIWIEDGVYTTDSRIGHKELWSGPGYKCAEHRKKGIFLAYGKGIKKGFKIKNAKIYDIAPTILHMFGLKVPKDMDGRVLKEIFEKDSEFAKKKVEYYEDVKRKEERILRESLKDVEV